MTPLPPTAGAAPGRVRRWILAARPATLTAAVAPVLVGTACAWAAGGFLAGPAWAALFGAVMIQVGTNLANDVYDFEKGADTGERVGPLRVTQAGLLSPRHVRRGMWTTFAAAALAGVYLAVSAAVRTGSWVPAGVVLAIGIASIASGIAYTAGPFPLGYHGLGDLFVMLFFGFAAVCGTTYVQMVRVPSCAWWAGLSMGAASTALLAVNNIRDRATDLRAGKKTIPVRFGRRAGLAEYAVLLIVVYAAPAGMALTGAAGPGVLLTLLSLPMAVRLFLGVLRTPEGPGLNVYLVGTGRFLLVHGLLLAAGIVVGNASCGG